MRPKRNPAEASLKSAIGYPEVCPYCNKPGLVQSVSGRNLVCQGCGRIVVIDENALAAQNKMAEYRNSLSSRRNLRHTRSRSAIILAA